MPANKTEVDISFPYTYTTVYSPILIHNGALASVNNIYAVVRTSMSKCTAHISGSYTSNRQIGFIILGY